jgi:Leucine-rich repeat (LRR) protein
LKPAVNTGLKLFNSFFFYLLSVNNITTLKDFKYCTNLIELYIRNNNIQDLNEINYLKDLKHLKILWLADNPCASSDDYRMIVLKALPSLIKLDNTGFEFFFISN